MKMIVAVIKPSRLDAVLESVTEAGASGLTVTEVRGYGRQKGKTEVYRGAEYEVKLLPKVKLEIAVPTDVLEPVIEALLKPTQLYGAVVRSLKAGGIPLHAMAHITGGGVPENLPR